MNDMQQQMMQQQMMQQMMQQQMMQQQMMDPYAGTCMASDMPMMPQQMGYQQFPNASMPMSGYMGGGGINGGADVCSDPRQSLCLPDPQNASTPASYAPPPDVPGNYQEIGAKMGPNALTIRVHKNMCKIEKVDDTTTDKDDANGNCACTIENFGKKQKPTQNR